LGRALATVINILDPDVVVLGGGMSNLPDLAVRAQAAIRPHVFTDEVTTRIVLNVHGDSSGVRGAAWL
jgi:fructokinase